MATWNSRGLRGSTLEELINFTIEKYEESNIALIQKIPTPIKPININHDTRQITLAYFDKKSTVDYIGVVQGIPVCFDAKECDGDTFSLQNVHRHQIDFMEKFEGQKGISRLRILRRFSSFSLRPTSYRFALKIWFTSSFSSFCSSSCPVSLLYSFISRPS